MLSGFSITMASAHIALFNKKNENALGNSLVRLASGKRVNTPSDSLPDYFFGSKMARQSSSFEPIIQGIAEGKAVMDLADSVGESVFKNIASLRDLVEQYYHQDTTDSERGGIKAEFAAVAQTVATTLSSSRYDGQLLVRDTEGLSFKSIAIDPDDLTTRMDIQFDANDVADVSLLQVGATDETAEREAVQIELDKAGSYLAKVSAYIRGLSAHYNINEKKRLVTSEVADRTLNVDTGTEMVKAMNQSIRHQSSLAFMAQANMYRMSVLRLVG